jgi:4-hydroxymandelate oxidase
VHVAIAIDVDAVGLYYQSANAISVRTSSASEWKEIIASNAPIPFILKGVLSVKSAVRAAEAGAYRYCHI